MNRSQQEYYSVWNKRSLEEDKAEMKELFINNVTIQCLEITSFGLSPKLYGIFPSLVLRTGEGCRCLEGEGGKCQLEKRKYSFAKSPRTKLEREAQEHLAKKVIWKHIMLFHYSCRITKL